MDAVADISLVGREASLRRNLLNHLADILELRAGFAHPDRLVEALARARDQVEVLLADRGTDGICQVFVGLVSEWAIRKKVGSSHVALMSPWKPPWKSVTSRLMMSPSSSGRESGIPARGVSHARQYQIHIRQHQENVTYRGRSPRSRRCTPTSGTCGNRAGKGTNRA